MDKNRRNFLKFSLIGGGAILLGKVFGSDLLNLFSGQKTEKTFNNFRIVENNKELIIYGKTGEAIFIIDKE
jgi:hypothetical protein